MSLPWWRTFVQSFRNADRRSKRDRLMGLAGVGLFLAASLLCAREISQQWPQVHRAITGADRGLLLLALAVAMVAQGVRPPLQIVLAPIFIAALAALSLVRLPRGGSKVN